MNNKELNKLMRDIQNGYEVSFNVLYKETHKGVFSFIYSYVGDWHITEDLLQNTYFKIKSLIINCCKNLEFITELLKFYVII